MYETQNTQRMLEFSDSLSHQTTQTSAPANKTSVAAIMPNTLTRESRGSSSSSSRTVLLMWFYRTAEVTLVTLRYSPTLLH